MSKMYEVSLPVFKQGDDMGGCMSQCNNNTTKAFEMLSDIYAEASDRCKKLSSVAAAGGLEVTNADTHVIAVDGSPEKLEQLEKEGLLFAVDSDDEEDDGPEDYDGPEAA